MPFVIESPLEIRCTYSSSLGHVVSEYIWLWGSIMKTLGIIFFSAPSGGRRPLEIKHSFPSSLGHAVYLQEGRHPLD